MWGELASHKRLFNQPSQFSRLGIQVSPLYIFIYSCMVGTEGWVGMDCLSFLSFSFLFLFHSTTGVLYMCTFMYFLALRPVLGCFITPAGYTKLRFESNISYVLVITSYLSLVHRARACGDAVVLVSYPSRGLMCVPYTALLVLLFVCQNYLNNIRVV